ncbi:hypothetical protein YC2023_034341 [Brassica napus]
MSGVWVFKNGVVRLVDRDLASRQPTKKKVLIHLPTDEVVSSHSSLEQILICCTISRRRSWKKQTMPHKGYSILDDYDDGFDDDNDAVHMTVMRVCMCVIFAVLFVIQWLLASGNQIINKSICTIFNFYLPNYSNETL